MDRLCCAATLPWEIGHDRIAYEKELIDWWSNHSYGRHIYIGHGIYRAMKKTSLEKSGGASEPDKTFASISNVQGSIYFSSNSFNR